MISPSLKKLFNTKFLGGTIFGFGLAVGILILFARLQGIQNSNVMSDGSGITLLPQGSQSFSSLGNVNSQQSQIDIIQPNHAKLNYVRNQLKLSNEKNAKY